MLYLILAILSSALVSVVMRVSEKYARNNMTMLAANYVMCTAAAVIAGQGSLIPTGDGAALTMALGSACGVLYLLGFVLLQWNIRRNGVVLPATFQKLGVLVPTLAAVTVFGEDVRLVQLIGFALAIGAIVLMQPRGSRGGTSFLPGLIALLLCGGLSDVMSKVFDTWGNAAHADHFLVFTFLVALALCVVLCAVKRQSVTAADVVCGLALGVPNYMCARFLLWALRGVPAVVVYPTFSVGTIIVVTLVGVLCFREKVEKRKWIALALILCALVLLNI